MDIKEMAQKVATPGVKVAVIMAAAVFAVMLFSFLWGPASRRGRHRFWFPASGSRALTRETCRSPAGNGVAPYRGGMHHRRMPYRNRNPAAGIAKGEGLAKAKERQDRTGNKKGERETPAEAAGRVWKGRSLLLLCVLLVAAALLVVLLVLFLEFV